MITARDPLVRLQQAIEVFEPVVRGLDGTDLAEATDRIQRITESVGDGRLIDAVHEAEDLVASLG